MAKGIKIKPLADYVLIEPIKEEEKTKAGILLPQTAEKERPEQGKVIAVGPGRRDEKGNLIPITVKVGQKVLFKKYGPDEIKVDDKEYLICKEEDILAIIEE
ncbi:co-chaperone GroES [Candidatus Parcubacteria bacterium]|nr:co-chaperone GroES [Candidatus Parcubacteria bacterium]